MLNGEAKSWKEQARNFQTPRQPRAGWLGSHQRGTVVACVAVTVLVLLVVYNQPGSAGIGGSILRGAASLSPFKHRVNVASLPKQIDFTIIADLDKRSRMESRKPSWFSILRTGSLVLNNGKYNLTWKGEHEIITKHGEAGRGMELSELLTYEGAMYSFDDRSGIVYEIADYGTDKPQAYPRHILMEGDGDTNKGFKIEWATRKDGMMYVGSFGKEYTNNEGKIKNKNNMWIKIIDKEGRIRHENWVDKFVALRRHVNCDFPGYLLHEAAVWSESWQRWMFFPRRQSMEPYDDALDEKRGTNIMLIADDTFTDIDVRTVTTRVPERGFSSVKEVPTVDGTRTSAVVALRSSENGELDTQSAFLSVLGFDGVPLMEEVEVPGGYKYEGVEILRVFK